MDPWVIFSTAAAGVLLVAVVVLGIRLGLHRARHKHRTEVVSQATRQMQEAGILLSLGLHTPEEIAKMQTRLKELGQYEGDIDGLPSTELLGAILEEASERGLDLNEYVASFLVAPRSSQSLPSPLREEIALQSAAQALQEAKTALPRKAVRKIERELGL